MILALLACAPLSNEALHPPALGWSMPTVVLDADEPSEGDRFGLCQLWDEGWVCEQQQPEGMSGSFSANGQRFEDIDGDGDGVAGFIAHGSGDAFVCEPRLEGWDCGRLARRAPRVQVVDLDGDGLSDLAFADPDEGPYTCSGGTSPLACERAGPGVRYHWNQGSWGDLDGDGDLDLVGALFKPFDEFRSEICLAEGEDFDCRDFSEAGNTGQGLATAALVFDGDQDGLADVYVESAAEYNSPPELCWNKGAGAFSCSLLELPELLFGGEAFPGASVDVKSADVDGDGWEDLVLHTRSEALVCWNGGGRSFECGFVDPGATGELDRAQGVNQVAVRDLDSDGRLDLVIAGSDQDEGPRACWNEGGRSFLCEEILAQATSGGVAVLWP